ncbi:unnamed protein product, partial [Ectocarpus sp. 8 AP-2014]
MMRRNFQHTHKKSKKKKSELRTIDTWDAMMGDSFSLLSFPLSFCGVFWRYMRGWPLLCIRKFIKKIRGSDRYKTLSREQRGIIQRQRCCLESVVPLFPVTLIFSVHQPHQLTTTTGYTHVKYSSSANTHHTHATFFFPCPRGPAHMQRRRVGVCMGVCSSPVYSGA